MSLLKAYEDVARNRMFNRAVADVCTNRLQKLGLPYHIIESKNHYYTIKKGRAIIADNLEHFEVVAYAMGIEDYLTEKELGDLK